MSHTLFLIQFVLLFKFKKKMSIYVSKTSCKEKSLFGKTLTDNGLLGWVKILHCLGYDDALCGWGKQHFARERLCCFAAIFNKYRERLPLPRYNVNHKKFRN